MGMGSAFNIFLKFIMVFLLIHKYAKVTWQENWKMCCSMNMKPVEFTDDAEINDLMMLNKGTNSMQETVKKSSTRRNEILCAF
jgi:hypothetical protein